MASPKNYRANVTSTVVDQEATAKTDIVTVEKIVYRDRIVHVESEPQIVEKVVYRDAPVESNFFEDTIPEWMVNDTDQTHRHECHDGNLDPECLECVKSSNLTRSESTNVQ